MRYTDAMILLREIKRLRDIVTETAALVPLWGQNDEETVERVDRLMEAFETEPCVVEEAFYRASKNRDEIDQKRNAQPRGPDYGIR